MTGKKRNRTPSKLFLRTIGEWGLLNKFLPQLASFKRQRLVVPTGDDAAILRSSGRMVLSIDGLVDRTHFDMSWMSGFQKKYGFSMGRGLGWKLLGSSLSDLAAMGETKNRWAMVFLGSPSHVPVAFLMDFLKGLKDYARRYDCAIVGGDIVQSPVLSVAAAVGGELKGGRFLTRTGAKEGDVLCVAGSLGEAAQGLSILQGRSRHLSNVARRFFVRRFFEAVPMFQQGAELSRNPQVTSLMDLSDPFDQSVAILARSSKVGFWVNLDMVCAVNGEQNMGGEDYSLLFTVHPKGLAELSRRLAFTIVGEAVSFSKGVRFFSGGRPLQLKSKSFEHFR